MERLTKARKVKATVKAKAQARARIKVKTKVRRQRKPTQKLVWTRSEQQQLETAKVYSKGIMLLWTVGPMCGSNTRKTNQ